LLKRVTIIGHPLAAEENRLAFQGWQSMRVDLVLPKVWKAHSLGTDYLYKNSGSEKRGKESLPNVYPLAVFAGGRNSLFFWIGLGALLKELHPDLIYCWEEPWCISTWQVSVLAKNLGIPLVFYSAENRPKRLPWPFTRIQTSTFFKYQACIVPTKEISARIQATGFTKRIFEIPLWIRPRRLLKIKSENKCIAYVGRLISLKRVHLLIECMELLPQFRLIIIGDGPERINLVALARKLRVQDRVKFLGHLDNANLEAGLEGSSLLVLPTGENLRQAEQFGKAALEGVSCGLPVLTSRTGNLSFLAERIKTMAACDIDSAKQMAIFRI
jgi:glycosyltransferase involved in cell wall biosynthesis